MQVCTLDLAKEIAMRILNTSQIRSEFRSRLRATATDALQARLRILRGSPLFGDLPDDAIESLALSMTERQVAPNEVIFLQTEEGSSLFGILVGEVRILIGDIDGREQVLRVLGPGEIFGEIAALDGRRRSATAIAVTRCRLVLLGRSGLLALISSQPHAAIGLIENFCERMRYLTTQVEGLSFHTSSERLASAVLGLRKDNTSMSVNVTQTELGHLTGVTREWVNKRLRAWQTAGLVELEPGRVRITDIGGLIKLLPNRTGGPL
jgi:CRP/FNR family cyclic AMP-dependent transcriptional regulator